MIDDRYEVLRVLSTGGFGVVHFGWDREAKRPIAIKELAPGHVGDPEVVEMFLDEARLTRNLLHPKIVTVHELRQDQRGGVFLIMEYLDGMDLETMLGRLAARGKRLPAHLALHIISEVLDALEYAHKFVDPESGEPARIVHRDVSPPNIVILASGAIKLIDFGIAKAQHRLAQKTKSGVLKGRLSYVSPEQLAATARRPVDARSDVFSAGTVLYEMCVGRRAFDNVNEFELMRAIAEGRYDRSVFASAALPDELCRLIECALRVEPGMRFQSAGVMRDEATRVAHALGARNSATVLSQIVAALLTDAENEERRSLLLLHGSTHPEIERVSTTPIRHLPSVVPRMTDDEPKTEPPSIDRTMPGVVLPKPVAPRAEPESPRPTIRRSRPSIAVIAIAVAAVYLLIDLLAGGPIRGLLHGLGSDGLAGGDSTGYVITIPAGAEISLNGVAIGTSPHKVDEWPEGPVTLRIEYPGFEPIDTVLTSGTFDRDGSPRLSPFVLQTRVHLRSLPEGARARVDGAELSDWESADWKVRATDTVEIQLALATGQTTPSAYFTPLAGLLEPTDTTRWTWVPPSGDVPGQLIGAFTRPIRLQSLPPGADVYVDGDSVSAGRTELVVNLTYGEHSIVLRRDMFLDYGFQFDVGTDTPDVLAPVLKRTVQIRAADRTTPSVDLAASVEWIRQGTTYIKTPRDRVQTPYSIALGGVPHELSIRHPGYRDTTVILPPEAFELLVAMTPGESWSQGNGDGGYEGSVAADSLDLAWVQFIVRDNRGPVPGAEVIGIEKSSGIVVRYGLTDESGEIFTRVPIGDYNWEASKEGYQGRPNGERISRRRDYKKITLRLTGR
ncbi:MAG: protein kinase [Candidatus Zixiibacteriota bacterium]